MFTTNKNVRGTAEDNAILNLGDDYGKRSRQKKDVKKKGKTLKEKRAAKREKKK